MPTFLWTGKTPAGDEEAERVTADTPEAARKILEDRGWTDLRLHTTEIHDFVKQHSEAASNPDYRPKLTPKEELAFVQGTAPGFWVRWWKSMDFSENPPGFYVIVVALLVLLGLAISHGQTGRMIFYTVFLLALWFLFPILYLWFGQTKRAFVRLHTANTWHRWQEVLDCVNRLEQAQSSTKIAIGKVNTERYRARALTGLGRLDEGLEVFRTAAAEAKMPAWLFHTFEGGLYRVTKNYDQALVLYRLALDEATDKTVPLIDLAAFLVEHFDRPAEARELLDQAEKLQLSETARIFLPGVRGKIAWREKKYADADRHLREALASFQNKPAKQYYLYEGSILSMQGYLAVCNAALGNKADAKKFFKQAEAYLRAVGSNELLSQYQARIAVETR